MKNSQFVNQQLESYSSFKNQNLSGRYITYSHIEPEIKKLGNDRFSVEEIGRSVLKTPIHAITFGKGPVKVLGWSQMHGNETTTTKALFDLLNLFTGKLSDPLAELLEHCTIKIIPMLNPDGAVRYTRVNVNEVDLNRDAHALLEPESRVLRTAYEAFLPHYCLNLHDQRTIFSAGDTAKPATLSFLAPAMDQARSIPESRRVSMQLIAAVNDVMQDFIPGQIGRYDDAFNINCTGDTFQNLGVPTILFEAGHYQHDYLREKTREFMAMSILLTMLNISHKGYSAYTVEDYAQIPENRKNFFDIILRKARTEEGIMDIAIQFEEKVKARKIYFEPVVQKSAPQIPLYGHQEFDCEGARVQNLGKEEINENAVVDQILLNNNKFSIKTLEFVQ